MAFRFERAEGPAAGIRRVVAEQVDRSIDALREVGPETRDDCVHDVRKRAKRVRATIRLARDDLGDEVYRRENACFRDVARTLAPIREARVLVETLDSVLDRYGDQIRPDAFDGVRKVLGERYHAATHRAAEADAIDSACQALDSARRRVADWPLTARDLNELTGGAERTYERAREAFTAAAASSDDVVFHEWRKQVKHVWHQVQLVAPAWPEVLEITADELHRLADDLGHAHDLALLGVALAAEPGTGGDPVAVDALAALVERRRPHLHEVARARGRRLFAEAPDAFAARIGAYLDAWRHG